MARNSSIAFSPRSARYRDGRRAKVNKRCDRSRLRRKHPTATKRLAPAADLCGSRRWPTSIRTDGLAPPPGSPRSESGSAGSGRPRMARQRRRAPAAAHVDLVRRSTRAHRGSRRAPARARRLVRDVKRALAAPRRRRLGRSRRGRRPRGRVLRSRGGRRRRSRRRDRDGRRTPRRGRRTVPARPSRSSGRPRADPAPRLRDRGRRRRASGSRPACRRCASCRSRPRSPASSRSPTVSRASGACSRTGSVGPRPTSPW